MSATPECPMNDVARVFSLSLPSEPASLSVVRSFVEAVGQSCNLDRSIVRALVLAAGEAITNILRHAHRDLPGAKVELRVETCPDNVMLVFQDQGAPFDIEAVP